jgi:hypothetical protein
MFWVEQRYGFYSIRPFGNPICSCLGLTADFGYPNGGSSGHDRVCALSGNGQAAPSGGLWLELTVATVSVALIFLVFSLVLVAVIAVIKHH